MPEEMRCPFHPRPNWCKLPFLIFIISYNHQLYKQHLKYQAWWHTLNCLCFNTSETRADGISFTVELRVNTMSCDIPMLPLILDNKDSLTGIIKPNIFASRPPKHHSRIQWSVGEQTEVNYPGFFFYVNMIWFKWSMHWALINIWQFTGIKNANSNIQSLCKHHL